MTEKTRQDSLKDEMTLEKPETPLKKQRRTPRACDRCRLNQGSYEISFLSSGINDF